MPAGSTCGCGRRIAYWKERCDTCQTALDERRDKARAEIRTPEWRKLRRQVLMEEPICACGNVATEVDHVIPRARGGQSVRSNLRGVCRPCNLKKGAK